MRQIILDTETTGLRPEDGHRVIEIGCLVMNDRRLTDEQFHVYINPQREIDAGAVAVHGITNHFLKDKPLFKDIAKEFIEFVNGAELIIHNAPFDVGFLNYELQLGQMDYKSITEYCIITDTLAMARKIHVGQRNSLDALCKRYKVDNSKRDLHGALVDAHLLGQVYLAMTGGQGSFFDLDTDHQASTNKTITQAQALTKKYQLPVINANESELKDHEAYLESLQKKGKCIWKEEETIN